MKVSALMMRRYQSLHTWTGISAGLLLFIGFFAGSLTLFKSTLQQWVEPPAPFAAHDKISLSPSTAAQQLLDAAFKTAVEPQDSEVPVATMLMTQGFQLNLRAHPIQLSWYPQGSQRGLQLEQPLTSATLGAAGQLQLQTQIENRFADLLDYLHRSAGIAGEIGHDQAGVYVMGIAAMLYFLALVSGVIMLLPTLRKTIFRLRPNKGRQRLWLDSHNLIGIVSLPFHFIIAWSVIVFAFHDVLYTALTPFYGEQPLFNMPAAVSTATPQQLAPVADIITAAQNYSPQHTVVHLEFLRLQSPAPVVIVQMHNDTGLVRGPTADYLYLNPYTLQVLPFSFDSHTGTSFTNVVNTLFALHFGSFAGQWGRWGYFILGWFGAFLFYSGNLLWLSKRAPHTRSTRVMAALTVGVCLGSMLGVVFCMVGGKLSSIFVVPEHFMRSNYSYLTFYYSYFIGYICWSLHQGALVAMRHGLWMLCVGCASFPLLSWLSLWHSGINDVTQYPWGVDIIAMLFAAIFAKLAWRQRKQQPAIDGQHPFWVASRSSG